MPDKRNQNAGYLFQATGAVQNTLANNSYGGVVYSYSSQSLRVWYPPIQKNGRQYLVYIDNLFGKSSTASKAELEITTFVPNDSRNLKIFPLFISYGSKKNFVTAEYFFVFEDILTFN